ncbi:MAG: hypothetical protein IJO71_10285 [Microbacterium sp.]|uniref:hypothetical protein n=1 Tax=Microbacterium sp. TaxID=51671 RepID=UPI0025EF0129|nr:hypothetical protein [Microbacterium sp.]MBQ9917567.1 hypothetical protein [Microbacterium sp.]
MTGAFIIWLITVLIGLASGVLLLVSASAAIAQGAGATSTSASPAGFLVVSLLTIAIALVQLFVVFKMRAGRNWARIVLTALAVLQIAGVVAGDTGGWIGLAAAAVATVLMYFPASNAYFRRH